MDRKQLGAWYTPPELVAELTAAVSRMVPGTLRDVRVVDPACGDGRLLTAVAERLGVPCELVGYDVDPAAVAAARTNGVDARLADALTHGWGDDRYDVVIGNPPFLSQMAATTTRGGSSRHGGGPYADAAAEFLALSARLAHPDHGVIGLVLPQSILGSRDAGPVRAAVGAAAELVWSWWQPDQRLFDAAVNVCALAFRRGPGRATPAAVWSEVVTARLGVPALDPAALDVAGTLGDRAELNANFRDEYYALVGAVSDDGDGPPLVTSGLVDPAVCHWGRRAVRFAKRTYAAPRVDVARLPGRFPAWAARKLVPKVLVANQTRVIEAVADPAGAWLPGVPVNTVTPHDPDEVWPVAAVLTSPVASVLAWQAAAGTGLSTRSVRIGPALLGSLPWPVGDLAPAVAALRAGDVPGCGAATCHAYGLDPAVAAAILTWWQAALPAA